MKIRKFNSHNFTNAAHLQFHEEVLQKLESDKALARLFPRQIATYKSCIKAEDCSHKVPLKSLNTAKINTVAKCSNTLVLSFRYQLKSIQVSTLDTKVQDAVDQIMLYLENYKICRIRRQLEKLSAMKNLVDDLRMHCKEEIRLLKLENEVNLLAANAEAYQHHTTARLVELQNRPALKMKEARKQTEAAFAKLSEVINASITLETVSEEVCADFVTFTNTTIMKYYQVLKQRRMANQETDSQEVTSDEPLVEPVAEQEMSDELTTVANLVRDDMTPEVSTNQEVMVRGLFTHAPDFGSKIPLPQSNIPLPYS